MDRLDFGVSLSSPAQRWTGRVYGKNMLDEVAIGGDTITPFGTFSPLSTGRLVGLEVQFDGIVRVNGLELKSKAS